MLTEMGCWNSHVQLFHGSECVATVRVEYKDAVKAAIEAQLGVSVAKADQSNISTEEK